MYNLTHEIYCSFLLAAFTGIYRLEIPNMMKRGDLPMGRPREAPPVSYETFRKYVKKQHQKLKEETKKPKDVPARNFAAEQLRKDAEAMARGSFTREVFRPGSSGEPSEGL